MPSSVTDKYVQRAVTLLRAAEGEAIEAAQALEKTYARIARQIKEEMSVSSTRQTVKSLQAKIDRELEKYYGDELPTELKALGAVAVEKEIAWNVSVITGETAAKLSIPKKDEILARVAKKTYQGHTFDFWTKKEFNKNRTHIRNIMNFGFVESVPIAEIERDVALLAGRARRDVRTIVRSHFMHHATEAKETVFAINPNIIEGVVWVSTLDHRTTWDICGIRDGTEYDLERNPINHGLPWDAGPGRIHWNCRSVGAPKIIGVPHSGTRAATEPGAEYERGNSATRTGRVRKNRKDARERGIFKSAEYTTKTKYEGWLRAQSRTNIDFVSDVLGSKRAARQFRDGEVSLLDLRLEKPTARPTNRNSL